MPFPSIADAASLYITLVVPAYNERERLPVMLDKTIPYLMSRKGKDATFTFELIVVDDGSKDSTSEVVRKYSKQYGSDFIRLLKFKVNRGKGGAVKRGVLKARGKYILMVDADGATEINDLEKLEKEMIRMEGGGGACVAIGSRAHLENSDSVAKRHWIRNFLMHGFNTLVKFLCVQGIKDTQCGFKLFNRGAAYVLFSSLHIQRWAFDIELLFIARQLQFQITEVAVNWQEIDGSKLSVIDASLQMARDMILIRCMYLLQVWRIKGARQ